MTTWTKTRSRKTSRALLPTFALLSIFVSIGVGFIFGPGAGFLTIGGFVALFALALICGARMKARKDK